MLRFVSRHALVLCALASSVVAAAPPPIRPGQTAQAAPVDEQQVTVYLTDEGLKYHAAGCRLLKNKFPVTLAEAKRSGYTACRVCRAPR